MSVEYGNIIPFPSLRSEPPETQNVQPTLDIRSQLAAWEEEGRTHEQTLAATPVDVMHEHLLDMVASFDAQGNEMAATRMHHISWAFAALAHDRLSDNDTAYTSYKANLLQWFSTWQLMAGPDKHYEGVTLSHDDAQVLQWSLEHVGIAFDPGEATTCVPLRPLVDDIVQKGQQPHAQHGYKIAYDYLQETAGTQPIETAITLSGHGTAGDLLPTLQSHVAAYEAPPRGAITAADRMYARINEQQSAIWASGDTLALERIRDIRFAFSALALDYFSDYKQHKSYLRSCLASYAAFQTNYLQNGYKRGGVTLSQTEAAMLSYTLRRANVPSIEPEGDICILFAPVERKLMAYAQFRPHELPSRTVETAYALAEAPIIHPHITLFPGHEQIIVPTE